MPQAASYIGRFAPSPTGLLHFGSYVTALASYLEAKSQQGQWLLRIEDVDSTRCHPSYATKILQLLDCYGLHWDGEVVYQSQRGDLYQHTLEQLIQQDLAFPCECSRTQLAGQPHHGRCECGAQPDYAWRFLCPVTFNGSPYYCFQDRLQGSWSKQLSKLDDFVLKRRDGLWAYQLAVVCDDIAQGVTEVVRGLDIIDSTARQGLLYEALQQPKPSYAHLAILVERNGQKLSKQNKALPLTLTQAADALFAALEVLRQQPPPELQGSQTELLQWALAHWDISQLSQLRTLPTPSLFQHPQ